MHPQNTLNRTQLEILNMFTRNLEEADLIALKRMFRDYLAHKAKNLADKVWDEKGWTNDDMTRLSNAHLRRSSKG